VASSVTAIENLVGSLFNDTLIGDNLPNQITGNAGDDQLNGLGGNDTYFFADDFGSDTVIEAAAGGADTLDFSAVTNALTFNIATGSVTAGYSAHLVTHTGSGIESVIGGSAGDTFVIADGAAFPGALDGSAGSDWLDYHLWTSGVDVDSRPGRLTAFCPSLALRTSWQSAERQLTGDDNANILTAARATTCSPAWAGTTITSSEMIGR